MDYSGIRTRVISGFGGMGDRFDLINSDESAIESLAVNSNRKVDQQLLNSVKMSAQ